MAFADKRLELDQILRDLLGSGNVYFQPPENVRMSYPCIVYNRQNADSKFANNKTYISCMRYQVSYIDANPDSDFHIKMIETFPMCVYANHFVADNLNHEIFDLYY